MQQLSHVFNFVCSKAKFSIFQEVVLSWEKYGSLACHGLCVTGSGQEERVGDGEEAQSLQGQYHSKGEEDYLKNSGLTFKAKPGQGQIFNNCVSYNHK